MFTIGEIAAKQAKLARDREAVVFGAARWTYGQFHDRTNRLATALLAVGLRKGDRVAILAENSDRFLEVLFATAKAGLVATPLNYRLTHRELAHMLTDSDSRALFVGAEYRTEAASLQRELPGVEQWIDLDDAGGLPVSYTGLLERGDAAGPAEHVSEDDLAMLIYTGGTTGLPKGVMLSHRNLLSCTVSMSMAFGYRPDDTTLMVLPMFHVAIWPVLCHLFVGGRVVIQKRADVGEILSALQAERCTNMNAVPTLYNWMVDDPRLPRHDLKTLRLLTYAGSPFPEETLRRCIAKFGPIFAQGYGMTEAAPGVSFLPPGDHVLEGPRARLLVSAGREMPLTEIRIADAEGRTVPLGEAGEVLARGPNVMRGYWKNEALTRERLQDGWLRTGDVGRMDEDGYLFLLDRKADMIVSGGENVYPTEVESVLYAHPAVKECIVASAPDAKWGERVQAAVVLHEAARATEDELLQFCRQRLAGYKCPKRIELWDALPRSVVGKLLRRSVRSTFWGGRERQIG